MQIIRCLPMVAILYKREGHHGGSRQHFKRFTLCCQMSTIGCMPIQIPIHKESRHNEMDTSRQKEMKVDEIGVLETGGLRCCIQTEICSVLLNSICTHPCLLPYDISIPAFMHMQRVVMWSPPTGAHTGSRCIQKPSSPIWSGIKTLGAILRCCVQAQM